MPQYHLCKSHVAVILGLVMLHICNIVEKRAGLAEYFSNPLSPFQVLAIGKRTLYL